jgi:chaperonin GroES
MIIKPTSDNVIIRIRKEEVATATKSGILLVQKDTSNVRPDRGVVVALGKGRILNDGRVIAPEVAEGDDIIFNRFAGTELESNGETYLVIKENDILAILDPEQEQI